MNEVKRVVLLGRSSSGKTSVCDCLKQRGYQIGHEIPTIVLDSRKNQQITEHEILKRQNLIYKIQKTLEDSFEGLVFQDRSLIDIFAYTQYLMGSLPAHFQEIEASRYYACFELERLPFVKTTPRIEENQDEAERIYKKVRNFYLEKGVSPIFVPAFKNATIEESVNDRVNFMLSKLDAL